MLQNDFYDIIAEQPSCYTLRLHAEHAIYAAHFPGHPITPGACLIAIVEELLCHRLRRPVRIVALTNVKFLMPLPPTAEPMFTFTDKNIDACLVAISDNDNLYAKMSIRYVYPHSDL